MVWIHAINMPYEMYYTESLCRIGNISSYFVKLNEVTPKEPIHGFVVLNVIRMTIQVESGCVDSN